MKRLVGPAGVFALSALLAGFVFFFASDTPQTEAGWGGRPCAPVGASGPLYSPPFQQPFQQPFFAAPVAADPLCEGWYRDGPGGSYNHYTHGAKDGSSQTDPQAPKPCCDCGCKDCGKCKETGKACCEHCACVPQAARPFVYGADYAKIRHGELSIGGVPMSDGEFHALVGDTPPNDIQKLYICAVGDEGYVALAKAKYETLPNKDSFLFGGFAPGDWQVQVGYQKHGGNGIAILGPRDPLTGKAKELSWTTSVDQLGAEAAGALRVPDPLYDPSKTPDLSKPKPAPKPEPKPEVIPVPAPAPAPPAETVSLTDLLVFLVPIAVIGVCVLGAGLVLLLLRRRAA